MYSRVCKKVIIIQCTVGYVRNVIINQCTVGYVRNVIINQCTVGYVRNVIRIGSTLMLSIFYFIL